MFHHTCHGDVLFADSGICWPGVRSRLGSNLAIPRTGFHAEGRLRLAVLGILAQAQKVGVGNQV